MQIQDTMTLAAKTLDNEKIKFALIGGFALAAHGVIRTTQDIDLLVDGRKKLETKDALLSRGFRVAFESEEVLQLSGQGQLDILFANRESTQNMLQRAQPINNFPVPVVSAEDLIGLKIQAYKNDIGREFQDKADIQALLQKNKTIDLNIVKKYADMFNEWPFILELKNRI